jgi:hypothetical protein
MPYELQVQRPNSVSLLHLPAIMPHCIDSNTFKGGKIMEFNGVDWEGSVEREAEKLKALGTNN